MAFINKNKLLRVSNYPSHQYPGSGLHSYNLCFNTLSMIKTIYFHPDVADTKWFKAPGNCQRINANIIFNTKYKQVKFLYNFIRIIRIISINIRSIDVYIKSNRPILHIHSPMYILLAAFAYFSGSKLIFITYHGSDYYFVRNSPLYQKLAMKIFTHAFYIGTAMKSGIEKMHSSNSEVFNGVDNHLYRNTGNNRKKQIIAVGSLKKEKGYDYLIRGYKIFLDQFPTIKYKLLIAGEGYLRKNLTSLINTLELKTRVKLLGNLAQAELVSLYNESEIFILSSISEGFPKVLLEANSCGCKIIATDVGSIRSIINNPIATKSPDAIAVAISDSIKNYNVNVLPEVAKFTWENVAKLYKNTYDKFTHS